ncbi:MAG: putative oxidoreductase YdhV [Dehalococcoidia bacterium]|nr:putative oxidoreductase YdhV [Bacillota bacterium]MBT9141660.1 putative oxidoreductase YdhV [Bacillota bacterium]
MYKYGGYAGKYIRVDLSERKIRVEETPPELVHDYLGGAGLAARLLWDEVEPEVKPLSPQNKIIFATGPVTGTLFPPSGRYAVVSLSPLTGHWGEAHAGGAFSPELKYAGYDFIILEGKAEKPVYLCIEDDLVELRDASHLWGKDTSKTTDLICAENGDPEIKVACIGPAGENLVRYACVINDYYRAAGRTGMGAVMGSKNLKAIAVRGSGDLKPALPEDFTKFSLGAFERHARGEWAEYIQSTSRTYGTTGLMDSMNAIGRLPTRNHYDGYYPEIDKVGSEEIRKCFRVGHKSCFGCAIQCKYISRIKEGKDARTQSEGPEYETVMAYTSNILNSDLTVAMRANYLCNIYGMDTISSGASIAFAMECYEEGLITRGTTEGLELRWGDGEVTLKLVEMIARREGFGDLLAEGVREAAKRIGKGAERYAIEMNGLEASGQDGRAHKSVGLTYAVSVRGADHLRSLCIIDELGFRGKAKERFPQYDTNLVCDLLDERYKGYLVADQEALFAVCDALIVCKYGVMWPPIYYWEDFARLIHLLTGMEEYADVEETKRLGERMAHLKRMFNIRLGWNKANDSLHPRFTEEAMPSGPGKGQVVHLEPMLKEYYEVRGYDWDSGYPTPSALESVGLGDVANELKKMGRLVTD